MNSRHKQDKEYSFNDVEDPELRQIAHRLAATDLSNRSRIRDQLYQQLKSMQDTHKPYDNGGSNIMINPIKRSVATVAVMIILLVTVPVLTVLAQTILDKIGPVTVTNEQENLPQSESITVDQMEATPTPVPADVRENVQTAPITDVNGAVATNLSAEAAAEIAGFDRVREPSALPAGYEFGGRIVFGGASVTVDSFWHVPSSLDGTIARVSISQTTNTDESTYRVGPQAQSADVTIRDIPATLITGADLSSSDGQLFNLLLWQEGDYLYVMTSPSLGDDELLALAQSMYH